MTHIPRTLLICALSLAAPPLAAQDAEEGGRLFASYCATCHGVGGRGDGPTAPILTILPTDLTGLAAENDGVFPRAHVIARIDGRAPLIAHGSPMPVFGDYFEGRGVAMRGEDGVLIMTTQPVVDLVTYLETLQD